MTMPCRILLVDDDPDYHEIFQDLLELAFPEQDTLFHAVTGCADAIDALSRDAFDVVVIDYRLGPNTGADLIAALPLHDVDVPAVLLTGVDPDQAMEDGLAIGARDTLSKGELSPRRIRQSLRYAMESHRQEAQLRHALVQMQRIEAGHAHFLSRLSHEFRTPLNAVLGFSQILLRGEYPPDRVAAMAENIVAGGTRLLDLLEDVLAATAAGLDGEGQVEQIDMAEWIELLAAPYRRLAADRDVTLAIRISGKAGFESNRDLLNLAIRPLLNNGLKFNHRGGRLDVKMEVGDSLAIALQDTGIGMDAETLSLVHLPFFQQDGSSTRAYEGLGLGLTVTRSALSALGGRLTLDSIPGNGTTATLVIPRWQPAATSPAAARMSCERAGMRDAASQCNAAPDRAWPCRAGERPATVSC